MKANQGHSETLNKEQEFCNKLHWINSFLRCVYKQLALLLAN